MPILNRSKKDARVTFYSWSDREAMDEWEGGVAHRRGGRCRARAPSAASRSSPCSGTPPRPPVSPMGGIKAYSRCERIPHPLPSHRQVSQSKGEKGVRGYTAEPKASDRFLG